MNANVKTWINRNISNRDLLENVGARVTFIQIIGFLLVLFGIVCLIMGVLKICPVNLDDGNQMAVVFFVVMLGVAFSFPSLLRDQSNSLSTMRIVVFMMVNVICLLLLKIGWRANSFADINIDSNWFGIIAFIFGAKATQAWVETRKNGSKNKTARTGMAALNYSPAEIAKLAVQQNRESLKIKFPNISSISDAVNDLDGDIKYVVTIYLKDSNFVGIPAELEAKLPNGKIEIVPVEIVKDSGSGKIHFDSNDMIQSTSGAQGSICCMIKRKNGKHALVTAGHVYTNSKLLNFGPWLTGNEKTNVLLNGNRIIGNWEFQKITHNQDIALISVDETVVSEFNNLGVEGHYEISDNVVKREAVTLVSAVGKTQTGFILDHNTGWDVEYGNDSQYMTDIILIGSCKERNDSTSLTENGDSGGLVYHTESKQLVGIILGGNKKFTWVLPVTDLFTNYNFTLV